MAVFVLGLCVTDDVAGGVYYCGKRFILYCY